MTLRMNLNYNNNNVHLSCVINALSAHIIHVNVNTIFYTRCVKNMKRMTASVLKQDTKG